MGDSPLPFPTPAFRPIETERLVLREVTAGDAGFILRLLNDPDWLRFIGDRNVRSLVEAETFIAERLVAAYRQVGFGLWLVTAKADGTPMGLCGLVKRDWLDDVDIGFAFLPDYRSQGLAAEAAQATLDFARHRLGLRRVLGITKPDNAASARLLERSGLRFEGLRQVPDASEFKLFAIEFQNSA